MITRRKFIEATAALGTAAICPKAVARFNARPARLTSAPQGGLRFVLDMVYDNPGEAPFVTKFNDTAVLRSWGYNGQIPKLFPQCAITYDQFDAELLPPGAPERHWCEKMAGFIDGRLKSARATQVPLYPFTDVLVVPKALMNKYGEQMRDGQNLSILKPMTQVVMRAQINEIFDRFPDLAGITVRFGETYLHDTPFHAGGSPVASVEEHQALINLLREEVCVKRNKLLFYRTWSWGSIQLHTNPESYLKVTDEIETHPNLTFSIKHSGADFLRDVPFNETLGIGKHAQLVEVSCNQAGVYGKNAHPYYIGQGVIDGWEEMGANKKGLKDLVNNPRLSGVWTWTRGDGWAGPYITNEFWVNLNAWVISQFGQTPTKTEPQLFEEYARTKLKLSRRDTAKFRELCLMATSATFHGQQSSYLHLDSVRWWCRDEYLTALDLKSVVEQDIATRVLEEKARVVANWKRIEKLSREILLNNSADQEFLQVSSTYGRIKFAIIEQIWTMQILAAQADKEGPLDIATMKQALQSYDALWVEWRQLKAKYACCPSLYTDERAVNVGPVLKPVLQRYRRAVGPV